MSLGSRGAFDSALLLQMDKKPFRAQNKQLKSAKGPAVTSHGRRRARLLCKALALLSRRALRRLPCLLHRPQRNWVSDVGEMEGGLGSHVAREQVILCAHSACRQAAGHNGSYAAGGQRLGPGLIHIHSPFQSHPCFIICWGIWHRLFDLAK